jgi:hypothetical protein
MSEQPTQEWRIEIGKFGTGCRIFLNGEPMYPSAADLHMAADEISTLSLKFPIYGRPGGMLQHHPSYRHGDSVVAEGTTCHTYIEVDGRRFRVIEEVPAGDLEDGLFGKR